MKMRVFAAVPSFVLCAAACLPAPRPPDDAWVFSYFKGNGEDGLHLAWSEDGLR